MSHHPGKEKIQVNEQVVDGFAVGRSGGKGVFLRFGGNYPEGWVK
jgi:hypothetical protein